MAGHVIKGSVTAPAYSFEGDAGIGMDSIASGQIDFITGGVSRMQITDSGVAFTAAAAGSFTSATVGAGTETTTTVFTVTDLASLTSGIGIKVTSAATAITGAGRLIYSNHSGVTSTSGILNEFRSVANDETVIVQVTATAALALGVALKVSVAALTTGNGVEVSGNTALTTGILLSVSSSATVITGAGRLVYSNHTGTTGASATLNEFASAANDETIILRVTASDVLAAGVALSVGVAAVTTGKAIASTNNTALTDGMLLHLATSSTVMTSTGRIIYSNHTGNAGVSTILNEFASAATDETVIVKVTASAALAAGVAVQVSVAALTTGIALSIPNADALTTGSIASMISNSADVTARNLVFIKNTNTAAVGAIPLTLDNRALIGTGSKFVAYMQLVNGTKTTTIYQSIDATTPNGNLTAVVGDICLNGPSGRSFYCTGTNNWTASNA